MKYRFTLIYFLLLFSLGAGAQNITGIWKGYFIQKSFGYFEERYKFEVQIEQLSNKALNGVTYSYKTTVFYGKASVKGIFTKKTKNVVLNEIKLVEVKMSGQTDACLMTCYLDYDKMGSLETLTGTYTSKNVRDGGDCGSGRVYLEKTTETDFYKEDFLTRKKPVQKKAPAIAKKTTPSNNTPVKPKLAGPKPGAEDNLITKNKPADTQPKAPETVAIPKTNVDKPAPQLKLPKPEPLRKRSNEVAKTITTSAKEIKIDLYDNGEIDGDTITVYHNNEVIVSRKMLTNKPITFTIKADEDSPIHEFVMVAENLGSIPPNTALMIITAGSKRYEVFLTSTEKKNAMVVIEYKPDSKD